jgi:RHS repeat-associated protein
MSRHPAIAVDTLSGLTKARNDSVVGNPNGSNGVVTDGTNQNRVNNSKNETTTVGSLSLTYDNDGNLITDPIDGGGNLTYDAWGNRQTSSASYAYDALGRRITATEPDYYTGGTQISKTHQEYYSTDWQVLEDRQTYTPPGMCTQVTDVDQYVWGQGYVDDLVLRDRTVSGTTTRTYVQQDANHNVTALISTAGTVLERFVYDAYGKATGLSSSWSVTTGWTPATDSNAWRYYFQGGRYETGTGLYNFRNRDYSPLIGTWVEADPSGYADGLSLYQYEKSRPTVGTDPMGLRTGFRPGGPRMSGDYVPGHLPTIGGEGMNYWIKYTVDDLKPGVYYVMQTTRATTSFLDNAGNLLFVTTEDVIDCERLGAYVEDRVSPKPVAVASNFFPSQVLGKIDKYFEDIQSDTVVAPILHVYDRSDNDLGKYDPVDDGEGGTLVDRTTIWDFADLPYNPNIAAILAPQLALSVPPVIAFNAEKAKWPIGWIDVRPGDVKTLVWSHHDTYGAVRNGGGFAPIPGQSSTSWSLG